MWQPTLRKVRGSGGIKAGSVLSAILIWFAIHSNIQESFKSAESPILNTGTLSRTLPVTVIMSATDMRRFAITPKEVEVTVRGEFAALNNLKLSEVLALVNLTDVKDEKSVQKRVTVHTPTNVILVRVVPREVMAERVSPVESPDNRPSQD